MEQNSNTRNRSTRKKTEDVSNLLYGKIPPQARDMEEAVLGAILIEKETISIVAAILQPEMFYFDAHSTIYQACLELDKNNIPIDQLTATQQLRKMQKLEEVGGAYYLSELTYKVGSSANVEAHARTIIEEWMKREMIKISNDTTRDAYEDVVDVFDLIENNQRDVMRVISSTVKKDFLHIGDGIGKDIARLENIRLSDSKVVGTPVGIIPIDRFFRGFENGDLIIVAARPSMGKTALALSMCHGAAKMNIPIGFCSLEMPTQQIRYRLLSIESGVDLNRIGKAGYSDLERSSLTAAAARMESFPIYIDDTPSLTITQLRAKASRLKRNQNIKMLVVDYLQLMYSGEKHINREAEISSISRSLKNLAKELDIPVIALSQLNRSVETRGGEKRPQLSDLRESGSIEQDADIVFFIYRPEVYGLTEFSDGGSTRNAAILIVAKYRNGPTGDIDNLSYDKSCAKFHYQVDQMHYVPQNSSTNKDAPF